MSTKKLVVVTCDLCGVTALPMALTLSEAVHMGNPPGNVVDARRRASADGWRHDKIGRDVCPGCQPVPRPKLRVPSPRPHF